MLLIKLSTVKEDKQLEYKILIYGYGNPGRQDDGLGNALVEKMETWTRKENLKHISFDSNYQLNIEDAATIADKDLVIFADASVEDIAQFKFTPVDANSEVAFTSHAASPGYIVGLCRELYGKSPAVYLLHIRGYHWDFEEGLSVKAMKNLESTISMLIEKLKNPGALIEQYIKVS